MKKNVMKGEKTIFKNVKNFGTNPTVLTAVGIAGMVTSVVLAVKGTVKATRKIDAIKSERKIDKISKKEVVKNTWKYYIPTGVGVITSGICLIASNRFSAKKITALATAYKLSENVFSEYKKEVVNSIGKEAESKINKKANENIKNKAVTKEIVYTNKGDTLFYDTLSGRYFKSDTKSVEEAFNLLNHQLLRENYVSINEWYYILGLDSIEPLGEMLKWNVENDLVEFGLEGDMTNNGEPCISINYKTLPQTYDYNPMW